MRFLSEKNKDSVPDDACDKAVYFFIESLIDNIRDDIPTAYDAERVVEQIQNAKDEYGMVDYINGKPVIAKEQAIEIIKKGGIE